MKCAIPLSCLLGQRWWVIRTPTAQLAMMRIVQAGWCECVGKVMRQAIVSLIHVREFTHLLNLTDQWKIISRCSKQLTGLDFSRLILDPQEALTRSQMSLSHCRSNLTPKIRVPLFLSSHQELLLEAGAMSSQWCQSEDHLDNLILMSSRSKIILSFALLLASAIKLELISAMRHKEYASASTLIQVPLAVNVKKASPKTRRPRNANQRVYAKPMAEMLIAMAMVVADSREEMQSVLVLQASRTTVSPNVPNVLIQCLIIQTARLDLSLLKIQL